MGVSMHFFRLDQHLAKTKLLPLLEQCNDGDKYAFGEIINTINIDVETLSIDQITSIWNFFYDQITWSIEHKNTPSVFPKKYNTMHSFMQSYGVDEFSSIDTRKSVSTFIDLLYTFKRLTNIEIKESHHAVDYHYFLDFATHYTGQLILLLYEYYYPKTASNNEYAAIIENDLYLLDFEINSSAKQLSNQYLKEQEIQAFLLKAKQVKRNKQREIIDQDIDYQLTQLLHLTECYTIVNDLREELKEYQGVVKRWHSY